MEGIFRKNTSYHWEWEMIESWGSYLILCTKLGGLSWKCRRDLTAIGFKNRCWSFNRENTDQPNCEKYKVSAPAAYLTEGSGSLPKVSAVLTQSSNSIQVGDFKFFIGLGLILILMKNKSINTWISPVQSYQVIRSIA